MNKSKQHHRKSRKSGSFQSEQAAAVFLSRRHSPATPWIDDPFLKNNAGLG
ncbi:MAG: hypothetical protein FWG53_01070 [Clostridiales bacterium]|nr:hypothetical protein [Clostridiales bacterium]